MNEIDFDLEKSIKTCAFETYIYSSYLFYKSYSLNTLSQLFEMPEEELIRIISLMIINNNFSAVIDPLEKVLIINENKNSKTQFLISELLERTKTLLYNNEDIYKKIYEKIEEYKQLS